MSTELKQPHPLRNTLKKVLYWGILGVLLVMGSLLRKGGYEWMSSPQILSPQVSDELIEISPRSSFVIEFDQRMNKESVAQALSIDPPISYQEQWRGKRLFVVPENALQKEEQYDVVLGREAENVFGYGIEQPQTFSYTVGEEARILAIHPSENIQNAESITIFFSHAMIPDHAIGSRDLQGLFQISPTIEGQWKWKNTKTLSFTPQNGFPFSSQFNLNNRLALKTLNNSLIDEEIDLTYTTATIQLLDVAEPQEVLKTEEPFIIRFNQPISIPSLQNKLLISKEDGSELSKLNIIPDEQVEGVYKIFPDSMSWSYQRQYQVELVEGLLPRRGNSPLAEGAIWTFTTEPLVEINPELSSEKHHYFADSSFILRVKENIPFETFKESLTTLSGIQLTPKKIDQNHFRVFIIQNSQKRENIDLVLSKNINPSGKSYLEDDLIIRISKSPDLRFLPREGSQSMCLHLNQILDLTNSKAVWINDTTEKNQAFSKASSEDCEVVEGFPFQYRLAKDIIPPESTHEVELFFQDIYGNTLEQPLEVTRPRLTEADFELFQNQDQFFKTVSSPEQLVFSYSQKNINNLHVKVCQLSFSQFFSVEYSQGERWSGFNPSPNTCTRIKTTIQELEVSWDETITSQVDIREAIPDAEDGIFYVQVSSPSVQRLYGFEERAHGILQFSPLEVISKRGENSLIWVLDKSNLVPVDQAQVTYYNSDGIAVISDYTNEKGLLLDSKIKFKYDYLTARKGNKEVLLYAFDQAGLEPWRYGAPFNFDDNDFLFQVIFEAESGSTPGKSGIVILKQKDERIAKSPKVSSVVLTLETLSGDVLWRKISPVDDYGNIPFTIDSIVPLGREKLTFGICIGLHDSICQGTFLSTPLEFEPTDQTDQKKTQDSQESPDVAHPHLSIVKSPLADVGETISLQLKNLEKDFPVLVTAESDHISHAEVFIAAASQEEVIIELQEDMIPEVFFSVSQFTDRGLVYDMDGIWIGHQSRTIDLSQLKTANSFEEFSLQTLRGKEVTDTSVVVFKKFDRTPFAFPNFLERYYPKMGNSVLTASTRAKEVSPEDIQQMRTIALDQTHHLTLFPGSLSLLQDDETAVEEDSHLASDIYYFVHDQEGHMGMSSQKRSIPLKTEVLLEDFSISSDQISFLRPGDQVSLEVALTNKTDFSRNLLFEMESSGIIAEPSQSVFVGLSANDMRRIPVSISLSLQSSEDLPGLLMDLKENEKSLAQQTLVLQRSEYTRYLPNRSLVWKQLDSGEGSITISPSQGISPQRRFTISTSPIAYIIGNLSEYMKRDTLWTEEIIQRAALIALFKELVPTTNDHAEDLIKLLQETEPISNVLEYLQYSQREDGGWSEDPSSLESDLIFTISLAEKLSDIEQHIDDRLDTTMRQKLVSYLKIRLQEIGADRITNETQLSSLSSTETLNELRHIRAISALSPSGIPFANNWYNIREELSDHALVLLLLIFEDYRDARVSGSTFKIEELTQLLKERRNQFKKTIWIQSPQPSTDFVASSLYLQGLVRQASSHLDIPKIITWLNNNKHKRQYQNRDNQYVFLKAMASYLRLFQEQQQADKISLEFPGSNNMSFQRDKAVRAQFFQVSKQFQLDLEEGEIPQDIEVSLSSTPKQPLFVEVSWDIQGGAPDAEGISIFTEYPDGLEMSQGESIPGEIHILSPFPREKVIIVQHLPSLVTNIQAESKLKSLQIKPYRDDQVWYVVDQLPAGQTTIAFEWIAQFNGKAVIPAIEAFSTVEPDVYATSLEREMVVR